jgi:pyridoxine 5-phosphate synthase
VSLFVEANSLQLAAARGLGAHVVELHTGAYCDAHADGDFAVRDRILDRLRAGAAEAARLGLEVHAGHGLNYETVGPVAALPEVVELNIGHFLIGEAIFTGLDAAIRRMRQLMDEARGGAGVQLA